MTGTLLCLDGDPERRATTERVLEGAASDDVQVVGFDSIADAIDHLETESVDCLVTEYHLPDGTGLEAAERVRADNPDTGCVVYTGTAYEAVRTREAPDVVVEFVDRNRPGAAEELERMAGDLLRLRSHTAYPIAADEHERVAAVARYEAVLDDAMASLDRLCSLAKAYFDTTTVFVGLIDARHQQYVAAEGLPMSSLPRQETVCTYTLLEDGVTVIEDLQSDPLFSVNETLREAGLHAYAGAKLETSDGHVVGTLCVMDDEPRTFDAEEREFLTTLADEAMATLELHRRCVSVGPDQ